MSKPIVSVLIPVYNVKDYLGRCIESVLAQSEASFELLLVDDGSTDGSGEICDQYVSKDKRVRVIHQQNQGVSVARNTGLDNARGEWICFLDSDDYVDSDYLSAFLEQGCLREDCLNIQGWHTVSDVDGTIVSSFIYPDLFVDATNMFEVLDYCNYFSNSRVMEKLFNKKVLDENGIRFREDLTVREDALFVYTYRAKMKSMRLLPTAAYYYRQAFKRSTLSSKNHPYTVYQTLKRELIPSMQQVFIQWKISEHPRVVKILNDTKNNTCLSIIKSIYAYDISRRHRLEAWHDIFNDDEFFKDSHSHFGRLLNVFRIGCTYLSIPVWDVLCYMPFRFYYKYFRKVDYRKMQ